MATPEELARFAGPPQILCVGFFRTGTASLGAALQELGYQHIFHGLNSIDKRSHWEFFEKAALAKWPHILTPDIHPHKAEPEFSREDWDELFGPFDVLTDFSCLFAPELIAAYPDAKVILTERDVDKWYTSFEATVLACLYGPGVDWFVKGVGTIVGHRAGFAMQKALTGYFGGARTMADFRHVSKRKYLDHYAHIKAIVPKEQLLVYKVGTDGWEPLCRFLGKPVPERRDFPFTNEGQAYDRVLRDLYWRYCLKAAVIVVPYTVLALALAFLVFSVLDVI
ncbi:P-loop containing nucleoside triphosphate hydrolase protein [Plectosphaerella plurivora]|uniref:P-loop containing nucleoside triphosphate hydrolase protein n=1 Tax=Plectosphaerella plurivora TaxID=936078 RepID=A0A9P8VEL0_9PEZI|nr:P-loop containing nucleoside triphosphate hydrolase protein [Plectosphaerella plurivora]